MRQERSFERFVAYRYLRARRRIGMISIITLISVLGITIGVAALVVVLSVFNGFNTFAVEQLVSFDPHLRIRPAAAGATLDPDAVLAASGLDDVESAGGYVEGRSAIIHEGATQVATVRGVSADTDGGRIEQQFSRLSGTDGVSILLGTGLAGQLSAYAGDTVSIVGRDGLELALTQVAQPVTVEARVASTFSLNQEYDARTAFVDLETASRLFSISEGTMGLEVRLSDFREAPDVATDIRANLGDEYVVETWQDLHRDLYGAMELERWAAFIIVLSIIVVAVFNVLGSLTMTVIEKRRDIGLLKAIGASPRAVSLIFLAEGAIVGVVGTAAGLAIGLALCQLQISAKLVRLDSSRYLLDALPVIIDPIDVAFVGGTALLLATCAAIYPALRASKVDVAAALRWD